MKRILFCLVLLTFSSNAHTQTIPVFKTLRYDEDYSIWAKDTTRSWYKRIKYSSLLKNNKAYISMGGDIRYQYFYVKNEDWGEAAKDNDGYILTRYLAHTDFHLSKNFRTFIQLQSSLANGKASGTSPVDENPLDLHQAFIDIVFNLFKKNKIIFRTGRQELMYGSQRLVSVREAPNNRQSFDGAKIVFSNNNQTLDLFYSLYVIARKNIFDDAVNNNKFWGVYFVQKKVPILQNIDFYYFGLSKVIAHFDDASGKELRHSVGTRIWNQNKLWRYDFEAVYQFGKVAYKPVSAFTISANTGFTAINSPLRPEIGLKTELISGDARANDEKLQTFNPLFPRGAYFGQAALIGPLNLFDIHPSISLRLNKQLTRNMDYDIFWRYSTSDGIYATNGVLLYSGKGVNEKLIGQQFATDFNYTPNPFLSFRTEFTWFKSGDFLKAVGPGKNILFTGLTAQVKF